MRQRREMLASPTSFVIAALVACCCCLPLAAGAQDTSARTVFIKQPSGWFGVRISDQAMMDEQGNAFFDSYPIVTQVDPSSPAARAGVKPGDVLLSFNSHDMRGGSVELAKWLTVGAPFVLKIRRNDAVRTLRGTLARRPPNWDQKMVVELCMPERVDLRERTLSRESGNGVMRVRTRVPTVEPLPAVLTPALGFGGGIYPFAGAEFTRLNTDLCDALGVKQEGVFVTNVAEGSPARSAGLRGGDIILQADKIRLTSPIDLVRAIRAADDGDHSVRLQILRKHQPQTLMLRW